MNREERDLLRGLAEAAMVGHDRRGRALFHADSPQIVVSLLDEIARLEADNRVLRRAIDLLHAASMPPADGKAGTMLAFPGYWIDAASADLDKEEGDE